MAVATQDASTPIPQAADPPPPVGASLPFSLPPPPQPAPAPVDLTTQIVAGSSASSTLVGQLFYWARTLPLPGDDLQRDFGLDIYARIALDPQVRAALRVLVTAALSQPPALTLPVAADHPQVAQAEVIRTFCQANFDRLPRGIVPLLAEMALAALTHGHKVAEILCDLITLDGAVGPQLVLRDLRTKPLTATAFVQDAYGNDLGLLAQRPGQPLILLPVLTSNEVAGQPLLPLAKFAILTWDEQNGDPRGNSILRAVYNPWWLKTQTWPLLLAYKTRFGQPSVDIELPPVAGDVPQTNEDGTPAPAIPLAQAMKAAALQWQGGGVFVHPAGSKATLTEPHGQGWQLFLDAITLYDNQIVKALLSATLAVNEGLHRSGVDSTTHQDILSLATLFVKVWIAQFARQQILARLVEWNYGIDAVPLTPSVDLGQTDPQDLAAQVNAVSQAEASGYWNPSVMPRAIGEAFDARFGFPIRTEADMAEVVAAQQAAQPAAPESADAPKPRAA